MAKNADDTLYLLLHGLKKEEIIRFTRQFATLLNGGINLVESLNALSQQMDHNYFKGVLSEVIGDVKSGKTLHVSLKRHPRVFSRLYSSLVEAGEAGGFLPDVLKKLSVYMEKEEAIKTRIKSAVRIPLFTLAFAICLIIFLLYWLVPQLQGFYGDLPLPGLTLVIISVSDFVQKNIVSILTIIIGIIIFLIICRKTKSGAYLFDSVMLKLPVIGDLTKKTIIARITLTLGTLFASGVNILDSLDITSRTAGNLVIQQAVTKVRKDVSEGSELAGALAETKIFPPMVMQMIGAGEKSGSLDEMLAKINEFYEIEVDNSVDSLTSALGVIVTVLIGVFVGLIVIGMFLPIFNLGSVMDQVDQARNATG
ncbi:type II secretion system F family protein [Thermodesulfobacteriota bacterium]